MKICPKCSKTYSDETLNFCLDDGSVLHQAPANSASDEPPPTVLMGSPQPTTPNQPFANQPTEPTLETNPTYAKAPAKSSKTWLWAVGIVFLVAVLCGGGFIGLALLLPEEESGVPVNEEKSAPEENTKNAKNTAEKKKVLQSTNFSTWNIGDSEFLKSRYRNGELILNSKDGYFYVILTKGFYTADKTVVLRVKNPEAEAASLGYGLVVHSDPGKVLAKDYAFLIRSDSQQYRIVRHANKQESNIVNWTRSKAIRSGSQVNEIEVRIKDQIMSLYLNGEFIRDVKDYSGFREGVAGIYTSDDVPIAFLNLEIREN